MIEQLDYTLMLDKYIHTVSSNEETEKEYYSKIYEQLQLVLGDCPSRTLSESETRKPYNGRSGFHQCI
jgi:hypothetical protein